MEVGNDFKKKLCQYGIAGVVIGFALVLLLMVVGQFEVKDTKGPMNHKSELWLNGHFWFADRAGSDYGYIFNKLTGDIVMDRVSDIKCPLKGEKLAYFCDGDKYGYVDIQTFEVVIPPIYSKAADFCDGIAAVSIHDTLLFIKEDGQRLIDKPYRLVDRVDDCNLWLGYCRVGTFDGKQGVIDKSGSWLVEPIYENVCEEVDGYWAMSMDGKWGVMTPDYRILFSCQYRMSQIISGKGVVLTMDNHTMRRYDYDGRLLDDNLFSDVMDMTYDSEEYGESGHRVEKVANCRKYMAEAGYWGLMDKKGKVITLPLYEDIRALDNSLYLCSYLEDKHVLLNERGQVVNP